jgi:fructuronate reductase
MSAGTASYRYHNAMRLSPVSMARLLADIRRPAYDRDDQHCGIVHFGIGAFHRAHQALYTEEALEAGDRDWAITGVSLRSQQVREQLAPQGGLYTVTESGSSGHATRLVGAVREVLVAAQDPARVIATLAAPQTRVVSISITEKGYWRASDQLLDLNAADIRHDLDPQLPPRTLYGFLAAGLAQRRRLGLPGLTLLSCDNLTANGRQLQALLEQFLERCDSATAAWLRAHCTCPSTMVDRIVPATTARDLAWLDGRLGLHDAAAVFTEPFRQWVIEDRFAGPRPRWEVGGAQWVQDTAAYETAKLRMLNGAHSALAYVGLFRGHEFVHQAVADPPLLELVNRLMREESARSFEPAPNQSLSQYADALLARFANSARPHSLKQIAMDGSQKIPQRWLPTLRTLAAAGSDCPALLQALGAWIAYVRADRFEVLDPMATELAALWRSGGSEGIVDALFGAAGRFAQSWVAPPPTRERLREWVATFTGGSQRGA